MPPIKPLPLKRSRRRPKLLGSKKLKRKLLNRKKIRQNLSDLETGSRVYGNVARGTRNIASTVRESALALRYLRGSSKLDRNLERIRKGTSSADVARRSFVSVGRLFS